MGFLNFKDKRDLGHKRRIISALERRGWKPDLRSDWEIHGPNQDMEYQVYVGTAIDADGQDRYVVIHPRAVYEIDDRNDWSRPEGDRRIYCGVR